MLMLTCQYLIIRKQSITQAQMSACDYLKEILKVHSSAALDLCLTASPRLDALIMDSDFSQLWTIGIEFDFDIWYQHSVPSSLQTQCALIFMINSCCCFVQTDCGIDFLWQSSKCNEADTFQISERG